MAEIVNSLLKNIKGRDGLLLAGMAIVVILGHSRLVKENVYDYDESDYRTAAQYSIASHWLDNPSIPFVDFITQGREKGLDPSNSDALSEYIRDSGDLTFFRHYHGPLYWYVLVPALRIWGDNEWQARSIGVAWVLILGWTVYMGCLWMGLGRAAASTALAFIVFSTTLIESCLQLTPHGPFTVIATITLFLVGRALQTQSDFLWSAAAAALGIALATIEYAIFLAFTLAICGLFAATRQTRIRKDGFGSFILRHGFVFGVVLFLIWPGGVLKLTLIRNYMFFGYLALLRPGAYGKLGPLEAWKSRWLGSTLEWSFLGLLLVIFVVLLFRRRNKISNTKIIGSESIWVMPFAVYGGLFFLTTLLNPSPQSRYISSLIPVLAVMAGAGLWMLTGRMGVSKLTITVCLFSGILALNFYAGNFPNKTEKATGPGLDDLVVAKLKEDLYDARILVPQHYLPTLRWYLPTSQIRSYFRSEELLVKANKWKPDAVLFRDTKDTNMEAVLGRKFTIQKKETIVGPKSRKVILLLLQPKGQ